MTEDAASVPAPRRPEELETAPTRDATAVIAERRGITPDSARRWLTRHVRPVGREVGRVGENLWPMVRVRQLLDVAEAEYEQR